MTSDGDAGATGHPWRRQGIGPAGGDGWRCGLRYRTVTHISAAEPAQSHPTLGHSPASRSSHAWPCLALSRPVEACRQLVESRLDVAERIKPANMPTPSLHSHFPTPPAVATPHRPRHSFPWTSPDDPPSLLGDRNPSAWRNLETKAGLPLSHGPPKHAHGSTWGSSERERPEGCPDQPAARLAGTPLHDERLASCVDLLFALAFVLHAESGPGPGASRAPCRAVSSYHTTPARLTSWVGLS